jgi:ketosteroid isomerase-like protein
MTQSLEVESRTNDSIWKTVESYFEGINNGGWEALIADDMVFTIFSRKTLGTQEYLAATNQFLRVVKSARVLQKIVDGNNVCAITRYKLASPKGAVSEMDIAEIFSVRDGKINSNTIFFDTQAFNNFMASFAPAK